METSQNVQEGKKPLEIQEKNIKNSEDSEKLFEEYLNKEKIPFYRIDQNKGTQSEEYKNMSIRRPDYLIHARNGIFHVDVKYREKKVFYKEEKRFYLNQDEINKLFNFQNELHTIVWLAFTDNVITPDFSYAPISEIYRYFINISSEINKKPSKECKEKFEESFIYIPKVFLYDHLSFDYGFYKELNLNAFNYEIKHHIENAMKIKNPKAVKWARINSNNKL